MKKLAISTINATSIPNFSSLQEADWSKDRATVPSAGINISRTQKDGLCLDHGSVPLAGHARGISELSKYRGTQ